MLSEEVLQKSMEKMASSGREQYENGGDFKDRLPLVFVGNPCKFTARIAADKNGEVCRVYMMYNVPIPQPDGTEKRVRYTVEGVPKTRNGVAYMDWAEKDPILGLALKLKDMYNTYKFKPRLACAYYGEITAVEKGTSEWFKPGPCVMIFNGEVFKKAFANACENLKQKCNAEGVPVGKELWLKTLNPTEKGLLMDITYDPARQGFTGSCFVSFDQVLGLHHTFAPEVIAKFTDITQEYAPVLGTTNDANGIKIIEYYTRKLENPPNYVKADPPWEEDGDKKPAKAEKEAVAPAASATSAKASDDVTLPWENVSSKKKAADAPSAKGVDSELDAALKAMEDLKE